MPPKGDQETLYGTPWGGLDYSRPYNALDPPFLAPGTVNTSQINGFLTSAPWVAGSPYNFTFATGEFIMGSFKVTVYGVSTTVVTSFTLVVTNVGVYYSSSPSQTGVSLAQFNLTSIHTWSGGELTAMYVVPGNAVSFVEVNGVVYFTALGLNGIFSVDASATFPPTFAQATDYVSASYIIELGGRLFVAQCRFPGGGGTGTTVLPTVAWSGPGEYAGSGGSDPWNPVNSLGGGFNELSDVPDVITGLAGIGRSALISRFNGISQADPNPGTSNSGIQPYTFYHLWASAQGVGAYPNTFVQYGAQVTFLSSDNVYSISISSGLQPMGNRIIPRIITDQTAAGTATGVANTGTFTPGYWYFASIINIAGQLHYLLQFTSYSYRIVAAARVGIFQAIVYDCNLAEGNAWHVWDQSAYGAVTTTPFNGFSCPILQTTDSFAVTGRSSTPTQLTFNFLLIGGISGFGTLPSYTLSGQIFQYVPLSYDFASSPFNTFVAALFSPLAVASTTITFRAEVGTLGHKLTVRRLRIQADNAPNPLAVAGAEQQARVTFTGQLNNSDTATLAWEQNENAGQPAPFMQGNDPPLGMPIQTYYGDAEISDELVQPSLTVLPNDGTNSSAWVPMFRIATASLIWVDPKDTTS